jgi:SAM-dependent methyltransferase
MIVKRVTEALTCRWYSRRIAAALAGKRGLEIGGPSQIFSPASPICLVPPIYSIASCVDNCNFASTTVWSQGSAGDTFEYLPGAPPGHQYIDDATELASIPDQSYDFLLASHILEHVANPLKALAAWRRVLKPGAVALVFVPNKAHTFDHRRAYTTLAHLQEDFERGTDEHDLTHLEEILRLHDLEMDPLAGTPEQFRERSLRNYENRCLHQHVFSPELLKDMVRGAGFDVVYTSVKVPPHIFAFLRVANATNHNPAKSDQRRNS